MCKIRTVASNNRKKAFEIETEAGTVLPFPYANAEPVPRREDPVVLAYVDPELGEEGFSSIASSIRRTIVSPSISSWGCSMCSIATSSS